MIATSLMAPDDNRRELLRKPPLLIHTDKNPLNGVAREKTCVRHVLWLTMACAASRQCERKSSAWNSVNVYPLIGPCKELITFLHAGWDQAQIVARSLDGRPHRQDSTTRALMSCVAVIRRDIIRMSISYI